jgi:YesN/AraC family two-component response regulator
MDTEKTILFVDDEDKILRSIKRIMFDQKFNCLYAASGAEALDIIKGNEVHVLITDMRMPEMSGLELLRIVKAEQPQIVRIVLSGYTQINTLLAAINQGEILRYIKKPFEEEQELLIALQDAFEYYEKALAAHAKG